MTSDPRAKQYVGLSLSAAQELAIDSDMYVRNRTIRHPTDDGVAAFMDDWRRDRVNVWLDADGEVERAEIF